MLAEDAITDGWLGISTAGSIRRQMPDKNARNVHYEPVRYNALRAISGRITLSSDDVVCDIGCGKGRAVCWFARHAVSLVIGIDLDPSLTAVAQSNAQSLRGRRSEVIVRTEDAATSNLDSVTVAFMYNPFGEDVMRSVLRALSSSIRRVPRSIKLVYATPMQGHVFDEFDWIELTDEFSYRFEDHSEPVRLYRSKSSDVTKGPD